MPEEMLALAGGAKVSEDPVGRSGTELGRLGGVVLRTPDAVSSVSRSTARGGCDGGGGTAGGTKLDATSVEKREREAWKR